MEASGTGNMKFALNGALTIGTLDGANVEILEHVGDENMFIFGLTAEQVAARRRLGIDSTDVIAASPVLAEVLASVEAGVFSPDERDRYRGLVNSLRYHDYFLVCADFDDYFAKQRAMGDLWRRPRTGGRPPSSTRPMSAGSPPTARSANTPARSGTCPPMPLHEQSRPVRDR